MQNNEVKKTPLVNEHIALNAKMVDFAGWYMPVEYKGLREEHMNVRSNVGLFDVSHMGEIFFRGSKALETLQWCTTNDVSKLKNGQAHYSLIPNAQGGIVDDIIIYCIQENQEYLVCVNASNADKDFAYFLSNNKGADIANESNAWAQIAVQGPKAMTLVSRLFAASDLPEKAFYFTQAKFQNAKCIIARTGYTGEDGVEIFIQKEGVVALWRELLQKGQDLGVQAIGLGARDTLRTEKKYSLYGHEIDDTTGPYEAQLGWVVKLDKPDFIAKSLIAQNRGENLKRKLIGFKMKDKGIPRAEYKVFSFDNIEIGKVTSGTLAPSLNESVGIAYVPVAYAQEGREILIDIRGRKAQAVVVKTPFV